MNNAEGEMALMIGDQLVTTDSVGHYAVTISGVTLNADLSIAQVFYTLSGDEARLAAAQKALDQARGFLRTQLGKRLVMKFVPDLRFSRDTYLEDMVYARPEA